MSSCEVPSCIFREYDIRGHATQHLTPGLLYRIGYGFGACVREQMPSVADRPRVCVAYDGRISSLAFAEAFSEGVQDAGVDVLQLGLGPTPFLYWSEYGVDVAAAAMITGSHNPPHDNGIKMTLNKRPFYGEQIQQLYARVRQPFSPVSPKGTRVVVEDFQKAYANSFAPFASTPPVFESPKRPLKIVWDPGHGAMGAILRQAISKLPHMSVILNERVDGTFPNRSPDPTKPGALVQLQEAIAREGADVGFAFDGDGDRVVVVDHTGVVWVGDETLIFMAEHLFPQASTAPCIVDIKTSPFLLERLDARQIPYCFSKTGHVHIKSAMREKDALLGGEVSGHFFFRDNHWGFDDGLYAALRIVQMVERGVVLATWRQSLTHCYSSPEMRIECAESAKKEVLLGLKKQLGEAHIQFNGLDGIRVVETDGWWLLRASQTESVLVLRWEARDAATFEGIETRMRNALAPWALAFP